MNLITIDFESFYDTDYSLSKMSTEDYVFDERFEIILVSVKVNDQPAEWHTGTHEEIRQWLHSFNLTTSAVLAHHTLFDGLILSGVFGITAGLWLDTKSIAKAVIGQIIPSVSLNQCLKARGLQFEKGDEVVRAKGKRRQDFTPQQLETYANYCINDTEATYALFKDLMQEFPAQELKTIDMTLRMYFEPQLKLDAPLLREIIKDSEAEQQRKEAMVQEIAPRDVLSSNAKFAKLLESMGIELPLKESPRTGKMIPALAKNDPGWKDLCAEYADDPMMSAVFNARMGVKSTQEYTRATKLLSIAERYGWLRVPLNYHNAHTSRYGGGEGQNLQNLPQTRRSKLRHAVKAPPGYKIIVADLSQIEARFYAWLAGQKTLLDQFAAYDHDPKHNKDPYCSFGDVVFGRDITKEDEVERFLAKQCILGMGFGVGAAKFRWTVRALGDIKMEIEEAQEYVSTYRRTFSRVPQLWRHLDKRLSAIARGARTQIGPCETFKDGILLPDGLKIYYPELREGEDGWEYKQKGKFWKKIYGAMVLENLCQSLAQRLLVYFTHEITRLCKLRPALQVHDELVFVVKEGHVKIYKQAIEKIMQAGPWWTDGLPIAVEVESADVYGEAK